jgi:anti-sigma B factor antagonist
MNQLPGTLTFETAAGATVARLAGEIDMSNAGGFREQIAARVPDAPTLIVDLTAVTYFDSSGVRLLDQTVAAAQAAGHRVRVVAPDPGPARFVLRICAFRPDLLAATLDDAL